MTAEDDAAQADPAQEEGDGADGRFADLDPFERGPEITEVR